MCAQRGFTLVETMLGMSIALVVVTAGVFALTGHVRDQRRLLLEARVHQDLRAAADIVARNLRRAGHWERADTTVWLRDSTQLAPNPHLATPGIEPGAASDQVQFSYGRPDDDNTDAVDSNERFGFRLRDGAIWLQLGLRAGAGNWQQLTDPGTLTVTRFELTLRQHEIDLQRFCVRACPGATRCGPRQQVREIDITIEAHATHEPALRRSVLAGVRPPNDLVAGACPA